MGNGKCAARLNSPNDRFGSLIDSFMDMVDKSFAAQQIIEHAKACGTLNQDDRSRQYQHNDPKRIVKELNDLWTDFRKCKGELADKYEEIERLKKRVRFYQVKSIALTAIITGLAWEGLKAVVAYLAH